MTDQETTTSGSVFSGGFGRLWAAAMTSNLADGIARLAIPLAAVAITKDPVAIALLGALAYLPWLLFSVPSGIIVDRMDRRIVMAIANVARLLAAAGVALFIATDNITIAVLAIATVVFGMGETLFDNATTAITPSLVRKGGLDKANGLIQAAQVGVDMFVATPISGVLYSIAVILPMIRWRSWLPRGRGVGAHASHGGGPCAARQRRAHRGRSPQRGRRVRVAPPLPAFARVFHDRSLAPHSRSRRPSPRCCSLTVLTSAPQCSES